MLLDMICIYENRVSLTEIPVKRIPLLVKRLVILLDVFYGRMVTGKNPCKKYVCSMNDWMNVERR